MIYYTVRLNKHSFKRFETYEDAQAYTKLYRYLTGVLLYIIERRTEDDTRAEETLT